MTRPRGEAAGVRRDVAAQPPVGTWLAALNAASPVAAGELLRSVCASPRWAGRVAAERPFADAEQLQAAADRLWCALEPADRLAALTGHPAIGEQGGSSPQHSRQEQSRIAGSGDAVLTAIAAASRRYEARFGHVFLISAAGRSGGQILAELERRLGNTPEDELREATEEHRRITRLRLERLLVPARPGQPT